MSFWLDALIVIGCFDPVPSDNLKIDSVELYCRDNAREHRTDRYELVRENPGRVSSRPKRNDKWVITFFIDDVGWDDVSFDAVVTVYVHVEHVSDGPPRPP